MVCKLMILVRRKEGISEDDFHTYWSKNHPRIFLSISIVQEKVISYTQYHVNQKDLNKLQSVPFVPRGRNWDGIVNITVAEVEDLDTIFRDEDYLTIVAEDEARFLDRENALLLIGSDEHKKLDGEVQAGVLEKLDAGHINV